MSIVVPDGVGLYGGFSGAEQCLDERDWVANETVLSGDLNGDDGPNDCADFTDCCREHETIGCDILECQSRVCAFYGRCCESHGNGQWFWYCALLAETECSDLAGNWRRHENSYVVIDVRDTAVATHLDGFTIRGAFISTTEQYTTVGGYGMFADRSAATVRNTRFEDNVEHGAKGFDAEGISFTGCRFYDNHGGPLFFLGHVSVADSEFSGNGQGASCGRGSCVITNCHFSPGGARSFGSLASASGNLVVRNSTFVGHRNWGLSHGDGQALITDCTFDGNFGGVYLVESSAVIRNSVFTRNYALGMSLNASGVLLSNSILAGNALNGTAAIYSSEGWLDVDNCTFVENRARGFYAGALFGSFGSSMTVSNTIFCGNSTTWGGIETNGEEGTFYLDVLNGPTTLDINYSIVDGWSGALGGVGNSGADPTFADPLGPDGIAGTPDDDLRLSPGSPAINAGDPDTTGLASTDLDGHTRILCGAVDIGAYEFGIGDYDCNQTVNLTDFAAWAGCMTGPQSPVASAPGSGPRSDPQLAIGNRQLAINCEAFDFNADGDVDLHDYYLFSQVFIGP